MLINKSLARTVGILAAIISMPGVGASAAPSVTGVSGQMVAGNIITITGTSFSAGDTTPLLWDNFDSGTAGSNLSNNPKVGTWQLNTSPVAQYSTTSAHSGSQSAYALHDDSHQWSNFNVLIAPTDKLYQTFWFKYNAPTGVNGQAKISQIHGDYWDKTGKSDYAPGVMTGGLAGDWFGSYISTETGARDLSTRANYATTPSMNTWHRIEVTGQQSSAGGAADGYVKVVVDGVMEYQKYGCITRDDSSDNWNLVEFFTGMTNWGGASETYIDDAYLNNSWSRVELGDASTWSLCTHKEIQPLTAWSSTSIALTVNLGSFTSGTAYLYVVDANGVANANGYAVTVPEPATMALLVAGLAMLVRRQRRNQYQ